MSPQLKFKEFLNTIVIGILFELIVIISISNVNGLVTQLPFQQFQFLHKDNAAITIALAFVFCFPSWRFISFFVGHLMEPVKTTSSNWIKRAFLYFRKFYLLVFYGITEQKDEARANMFQSLLSEQPSLLQQRYKYEIETFFAIDLKHITTNPADAYKLFEMITSYVYHAKSSYDPFQAERMNTNYNFHARMAVLSNFGFWASTIVLLLSLSPDKTLHHTHVYIYTSIMFLISGHIWSLMFDKKNHGNEAVLTDFVTKVITDHHRLNCP